MTLIQGCTCGVGIAGRPCPVHYLSPEPVANPMTPEARVRALLEDVARLPCRCPDFGDGCVVCRAAALLADAPAERDDRDERIDDLTARLAQANAHLAELGFVRADASAERAEPPAPMPPIEVGDVLTRVEFATVAVVRTDPVDGTVWLDMADGESTWFPDIDEITVVERAGTVIWRRQP